MLSYYPEPVNEHFLNPRNVGDIEGADAVGEAVSFACGALLRLYLKIDFEAQRIIDARFKATGCGYLIASASALTETITEVAISRAAALDENAISDWFGEIPAEKRPCVVLCREALHSALAAYHNIRREEWTGDEALICTCFGVSEKTIEHEIAARSLQTVAEVTNACAAGGGCRSCQPLILDIIEDHWRAAAAERPGTK